MKNGQSLGLFTAMGVAVGAVMFAVTDEAWWIGVGAAIGVAVGAGMASRKNGE
jgi:MFS-type transporter involved in bile tolerance (Atg22 family)